jgi:hypothetical protein
MKNNLVEACYELAPQLSDNIGGLAGFAASNEVGLAVPRNAEMRPPWTISAEPGKEE